MALLSMAAALLTLGLKFGAYAVTGSVSLLSDAVESTVNLVAALTALAALWYAARPVDRSHPYGHEKIEFLASGMEGTLILLAAGGIGWYAFSRLLDPRPVNEIGLGALITATATLVNLAVARQLLRVARERDSIVLAADGRHLMADVLTSVAVIAGILAVRATGVEEFDPLIALLVAASIVRTGLGLMRTSVDGLLDRALPEVDQALLRSVIESELEPGATFHALRTRKAGGRRFVDFHLLMPGSFSLSDAHDVAQRLEWAVGHSFPRTETTVHLEPIEEPAAWDDSALVTIELEAPAPKHRILDAALR
jgi:cation diffusion facilitator family transporter